MLDKNRIIRIHAALAAAGLMHMKPEMLGSYGVESTKQLTAAQADDLLGRLHRIADERREDTPKQVRNARSAVMTLLNRMGIYADNGDWSRVNEFLLQPRICGKLLYELSLEELQALQRKLYVVERKLQQKVQEENYQAANN
jgi:hypothetical protein